MTQDIQALQTVIDAATSKGLFSSARAAAAAQSALDRVTKTLIEYAGRSETDKPGDNNQPGQEPG